jgi:hypothetical protein
VSCDLGHASRAAATATIRSRPGRSSRTTELTNLVIHSSRRSDKLLSSALSSSFMKNIAFEDWRRVPRSPIYFVPAGVCSLRAVHSESDMSSSTTSGLRVSSPRRRSCLLGGPLSTILRSLPDRRSLERGLEVARNSAIAPLRTVRGSIFADGRRTWKKESVSIPRFVHGTRRTLLARELKLWTRRRNAN